MGLQNNRSQVLRGLGVACSGDSYEHYMVPMDKPRPSSAVQQMGEAERTRDGLQPIGEEMAPGAEICTSPKYTVSVRRLNAGTVTLNTKQLKVPIMISCYRRAK